MAEYVQVMKRALQQLGGHGGIRGAMWQFFRINDLKTGMLVGIDKYGNKYYEDKRYFFDVFKSFRELGRKATAP